MHAGLAVRDGALKFAQNILRLVHQQDVAVRVRVGLAHFAVWVNQAGNLGTLANLRVVALRNGKGVRMQIVETVCNVAADLDVLALIHANRNKIGLVQQNVCRHQNRIGEQTDIDVVRMLGGFVLELGHAGSLAEHGEAVEHPCPSIPL